MGAAQNGALAAKPGAPDGLGWIYGARILIANNQFEAFTGSEVHCLELADFLTDHGADVTLVGLRRDNDFCKALEGRHHIHGRRVLKGHFDLIWTHQQTTFLLVHGILGVRSKLAIHGLLSSYLEQEQIPDVTARDPDRLMFLANSVETQKAAKRHADLETHVLRNIVPQAFAQTVKQNHSDKLTSLAIVSNHVPTELLEAAKLLEDKGVDVTIYGKDHVFVPIDETTLSGFDAVITIGKTAQYCLVQGIPLYLYDHFGGPGYFTAATIDLHEDANFSGRSDPTQRTAEELLTQIVDGYASAVQSAAEMTGLAAERYLLAPQLARLISFPKAAPAPVMSMSGRVGLLWRVLIERPRTILRVIAPAFAEKLAKARNPEIKPSDG